MKSYTKNQTGFSVVEVLLVLILISVIGFAAYYVGSQNKSDQTDTTASSAGKKADTNSSPDPMATWKTYTDPKDKVSFKYPSDWKVAISKTDDGYAEAPGNTVGGTVTSPSAKIALDYANYISGLGGGSCPDAFPCPTVDILSIKDVPGASSVKYIEKITHWKGNGDGYALSFGLISADKAKTLKVGEMQVDDMYLTSAWGNDGGYFAYNFAPNSRPADGFKTYDEAKVFLGSAEAKIAKQILLSFEQ